MKVDFVRFDASDGVELQGWLSNTIDEVAVIHIHGMSGNGYKNRFLDNMHEAYVKSGASFFSINTRGNGVVSDFYNEDGSPKLGGSCYEIFDECAHDIQGAVDYLQSIGKKRFILQGHSLGCSKVVHFITSAQRDNVISSVLIAPTDVVRLAELDPRHAEYTEKAIRLINEGNPEELVGAKCWLVETPLSAQTFLSLTTPGSTADTYRNGGFGKITVPTQIIYGTDDIGITSIDGDIEAWKKRVSGLMPDSISIETIDGAQHSFSGYEKQLADIASGFIRRYL